MRNFDFVNAVNFLVIGGGIVFVTLLLCLLAAGFSDHDIGRVWGALAIVWAPAFFIWGGRQKDDEISN